MSIQISKSLPFPRHRQNHHVFHVRQYFIVLGLYWSCFTFCFLVLCCQYFDLSDSSKYFVFWNSTQNFLSLYIFAILIKKFFVFVLFTFHSLPRHLSYKHDIRSLTNLIRLTNLRYLTEESIFFTFMEFTKSNL